VSKGSLLFVVADSSSKESEHSLTETMVRGKKFHIVLGLISD